MFSLSLNALVVAVVLIIYKLVRACILHFQQRRFAKQHGCLPGKTVQVGDPIIGLSFLLETIRRAKKNEYFQVNLERFRSIGTTYMNRRLLFQSVSTIDPENARAMLSSDFDSYCMPEIRVSSLSKLFGDGIFVNDGHKWAHSRSMLRPAFTKRNLAPLLSIVEHHFLAMREHLPPRNGAASNGGVVDLAKLFYDLTLDVGTDFLYGRSTNSLDPALASQADADFAQDYLVCCEEAVQTLQMGPLWQLKRTHRTRAARDRAWAYIDRYVDEALELREKTGSIEDDGSYNFLRDLANETTDREILRTQILNILLASRDTTAAHLGNLFWSLARNPAAWEKLRAEVAAVVGHQLPTEEHIKNMPYLRWCQNESLRIHPSVPANTRQTARDAILPVGGGHDGKSPLFVAKGTNVLMNALAMHRREDCFGPEPDEFRPERWDGLKPGWAYIPFQGGPRACMGQQFALTEAAYVITRMAQLYSKITPRDSRPYTEYYTIVLFNKNGVHVELTPA